MPAGGILFDEAGEPARIPPTPGGFTTSGFGGGGGGGGGFGGFGGGGFGLASAPGGRGFNPAVGRRDTRRAPVSMPGVTPGVPGPTDTVHALLSPGEVVMNNGVTGNPHMAQALMLLNMLGAHGMQMGGGQQPVSMAPQQPMGFAFGGMVPGTGFGGFGSMMQNRFPGFGQPAMQKPKAAPGVSQPAPPQPAGSGYTYNNVGGVTGGYDPNNPWGHFTQNRDTSIYGSWARQMGNAGAAGVYDPNGNQALLGSVRDEALANARAQQQGAGLRAQLAGMDPGAAASYKLEAGLRGSSDIARALSAARLQALSSSDQFYKDMAGRLVGANTGFIGADNAAEQQRQTQRANRPSGLSQLGQLAGQLGGAHLGRRP